MLVTLVPAVGAETTVSDNPVKVEKGDYDSYVVVMRAEPLLASFDQDELNSGAARAERAAIRESHDRVLRDSDIATDRRVNDYTNAANGFSALITHEEAERVAASPDVLTVMPDTLRQPTTDNTPSFLGLNERGAAWAAGYTGENVVVGVIDSGIWPEHPSFADDGTYRDLGITLDESVYAACDFGNSAHNPNDADFECNNKLIGARQILPTYRALIGAEDFEYDSARDDNGHGTHTASTAAGNADVQAEIFGIDRGTVSGIAPRARVIAYKGLGTLGGFGSDLAASIDQAVADGVDVINYSVGGGASLLGPDDIAYLFAADAGVFVATSAGNSGPGAATIGGPASVPWLTTVGASTQDRTWQGSTVLGDGSEYFGASITGSAGPLPLVDSADLGNELCEPSVAFTDDISGKIVLCLRGAIARVAKSQAVFEQGGAGMILYNPTDTQALVTDNHFVPSVHINFTDGTAIKDYIAANGAAATATVNGGVFTPQDAPWMADFSSRGPDPVATDIIKPDVTAPGVNVLAGNTPTPDLGAPGELFQSISGTSMSSPHVAGLFALLKQARRDWSPAAAKSALMTTAYQDVMKEDGATPADPFDIGAGHVDPSGRVYAPGSLFSPGLVYDAGFNEYLGFLCDAAPEAFADPDATCATLESLGIPTDASDLNLASIGVGQLAGTQTVTRTVTSVANRNATWRVSVDAPHGFDVSVNPSQIRLAPGASATYEVTFTATDDAVIGDWAFGSLTWRAQNGATARSPIAVNAATIGTPDQVDGTGTDGSASFDVSFGYTGDYSAAGHGLEAATITSDTVVQDPDQNFDPNDGFSNAHEFDLSGAAYLRVALPPDSVADPNIDLDIFLYDPNGVQVATSTNGGTDEEISILLPEDGTWTLFVHGWQTVTGSSDYDLSSWIVSATPGGSLSVDAAPTSATVGTSGTVDISWSGLDAGQHYLGAVSHSDGAGLIGITLVSVES
jgi:subtilisin family serine protease